MQRPGVDFPPAFGAHLRDGGCEFSVYAGQAEQVWLCLFDDAGAERRVALDPYVGGVWAGFVEGVRAGQRYGLRAAGLWDPWAGQRYNPQKLLADPYARALEGEVRWQPEVFGHQVGTYFDGDGYQRDERDSAPYVPRSVVIDDRFDWGDDQPPQVPWDQTVIYEAHVRGLTMTHPGVPEELRGTYAGVAHPSVIAHLHRLGVTTIELLPVHAFTSEPHLVKVGLENYWGYNTLGFLAPHAAYASTHDPQGAVDEFKGMVKLLHAAGFEVILDVVYNHTCEQGASSGATLSWRGLAGHDYYRLDERGHDVDVTGCGNTLDMRHPTTVRMVLDSLRYWVSEMHVDGFRFDLAVALGRGQDDGFSPEHPFLVALRTDPVLSRVKLIAEPWDLGSHGWRTGQFPPPFGDWNDRFRDTVRNFWLGDLAADQAGHPRHALADLGARIAGSPDLFGHRSPQAAINYVTAHDGFTMADLTAYNNKHNGANAEGNRDGTDNNRSWNFGVEGWEFGDQPIQTLRRRSIRNLLATLLLSSGTPMLLGGDELARSQRGNNNAYCQNNEIAWYNWDLDYTQDDLIDTTGFLIALRRAHPVLHRRRFFTPDVPSGDLSEVSLRWCNADGEFMDSSHWQSPQTSTVQAIFDGSPAGDTTLLFVLHGGSQDSAVTVPAHDGVATWELLWSSTAEHPSWVPDLSLTPGDTWKAAAASFAVFAGTH